MLLLYLVKIGNSRVLSSFSPLFDLTNEISMRRMLDKLLSQYDCAAILSIYVCAAFVIYICMLSGVEKVTEFRRKSDR